MAMPSPPNPNPYRLAYCNSYGSIGPQSPPRANPFSYGLSFQSRPWTSMMAVLRMKCSGAKLGVSLVFRWIIFAALLFATAIAFAWSTVMGYLLGSSLLFASILLGISNCCTEDNGIEGLLIDPHPPRPPYGGVTRDRIMIIGGGSDSTGLESSLKSVSVSVNQVDI